MRWLIAILVLLILLLQYRLWIGEGSLTEAYHLHREIAQLKAELKQARARNEALRAEVEDLRKGQEAIEERARGELGMIKSDETFYQIIETLSGDGHAPSH